MKVELFPFQQKAVRELRKKTALALNNYKSVSIPQVLSLQAPTGSGKTIIMASFIEGIYNGMDEFIEQPEAIFVWLSDSPELNEQSKQKIDLKADKIRLNQCVTIEDQSFDKEMLEDGHIYFLNTQKIGKSGNLGKHSDARQYTIWETLANTAENKSDHLYFIIDEAHRGMQGRQAGEATSVMQRFIKGYDKLHFPCMPLVIGISATAERFNALVGETSSSLNKCIITPEDVKSSGLLKDRILINYSDNQKKMNDVAVLKAAIEEWKNKCDHWRDYCDKQHYYQVKPVFVIQVCDGKGDNISNTNLSDVIGKIEEQLDIRFKENEVVHTFGSTGDLTINGLTVPHINPTDISDDRTIKVVFFKENLSTGWDCPRAETMMSFRHAEDYTFIAQLLGRMVRTPLQSHIKVDETLNEVRLFLPYFNVETVQKVIDEFQSSEGGQIPTVIEKESIDYPFDVTLSVHYSKHIKQVTNIPGQTDMFLDSQKSNNVDDIDNNSDKQRSDEKSDIIIPSPQKAPTEMISLPINTNKSADSNDHSETEQGEQISFNVGIINREDITKFINNQGYLTYVVKNSIINSYLKSLLGLAGILTQSGIYPNANNEIENEIIDIMRTYILRLHKIGKYNELSEQVRTFKLSVKTYDVFGQSLNYGIYNNYSIALDSDLDIQLREADARLGSYGFPYEYGKRSSDESNSYQYKIDCILFVSNEECISSINNYAKDKFHILNDKYRIYVVSKSERCKKEYSSIVENGDKVSKHNFCLPETINVKKDVDGKEYVNHLFVDEDGIARISLNSWESGVIKEEEQSDDFVCWLRNQSRASWALCIPYQKNEEIKPMYPDFIIIRSDSRLKYVIDILEPHNPSFDDNLAKAKGLAKYAEQEIRIGRIQLIRKTKDESGKFKFMRLDFCKGSIRDKVIKAQNNEELNHIFETDGFYN